MGNTKEQNDTSIAELAKPSAYRVRRDFEDKHSEELSPVRYARKKVVEIGITAGAAAGGALAGYQVVEHKPEWVMSVKAHSLHRTMTRMHKTYSEKKDFAPLQEFLNKHGLNFEESAFANAAPAKEKVKEQLVAAFKKNPEHGATTWTVAGIGAAVSGLIATAVFAYEHWVKQESTKIGVQEINADISNVKMRTRTDPELVRENERLRGMLHEEEVKTQKLRTELEAKKQAMPQAHVAASQLQQMGRVSESGVDISQVRGS